MLSSLSYFRSASTFIPPSLGLCLSHDRTFSSDCFLRLLELTFDLVSLVPCCLPPLRIAPVVPFYSAVFLGVTLVPIHTPEPRVRPRNILQNRLRGFLGTTPLPNFVSRFIGPEEEHFCATYYRESSLFHRFFRGRTENVEIKSLRRRKFQVLFIVNNQGVGERIRATRLLNFYRINFPVCSITEMVGTKVA